MNLRLTRYGIRAGYESKGVGAPQRDKNTTKIYVFSFAKYTETVVPLSWWFISSG
jgi:hypothetical protein